MSMFPSLDDEDDGKVLRAMQATSPLRMDVAAPVPGWNPNWISDTDMDASAAVYNAKKLSALEKKHALLLTETRTV